ncbi:MAG: hypothetical protein PGN25_07985 [Methylorubrum populi]
MALERSNTDMGRMIEDGRTVHQVIGFLAFGATGWALLHSWDLPKAASFGLLLLALTSAAVAGIEQSLQRQGSSEPVPTMSAAQMPPTEGQTAPMRTSTRLPMPRTEAAFFW